MDFGLRSAKNPHREGTQLGWCDITSLLLKRRGTDRYDFGLTLQGCVIRPAADATKHSSAAQKMAPQSNDPISGHIRFDEDALFRQFGGLRDIFSCAVFDSGLDNDDPRGGHSRLEEQSDFAGQAPNWNLETNYDLDAIICPDAFSPDLAADNVIGQFSSLPSDPFFGECAQDTEGASLSNLIGMGEDLHCHLNTETSSAIHESGLSQAFGTQEDETTLLTPPPSLERKPSPTGATNGRRICRLCNSTFARPGDLKRHSRVHFPEHRNFHCGQPHCGRNGKHGFYRRDKLRAHQRQVHNM